MSMTAANVDPFTQIPRHTVRADLLTPEQLAFEEEVVANKQDYLEEDPANIADLLGLITGALRAAGAVAAMAPDDARVARYLGLAGRGTLAACLLAEAEAGAQLQVDLGNGRSPLLEATGGSLIDVYDYAKGHLAATAARDRDCLDRLSRIELARLQSGTSVDPWTKDWARTLQGFHLGAPWTGDALVRALKGADPNGYPQGSAVAAHVAFLDSPVIELLATTANDGAAFNAKLHEAVAAHRAYHGDLRFDPPIGQQNDPAGFIALGPLALAVAMADRGWSISVRSDYLPPGLLAG